MTEEQDWQLRLIAEVRKRPLLWDYKNASPTDTVKRNELWVEIGQILNTEEYKCKQAWTKLGKLFRKEVGFTKERVAKAKKAGTYDPHKKYWRWTLFDNLRFTVVDGSKLSSNFENNSDIETDSNSNTAQIKSDLVDRGSRSVESNGCSKIMESDNLVQKAVDKCRLIEEVRKRPALWNKQTIDKKKPKKRAELWIEIGQVLNTEAHICKQVWANLRTQFRKEVPIIKKRIAKAKRAGTYDQHKKYYSWTLFDNLKFASAGSKLNSSLKKKSHIKADTNDNAEEKFRLIEEVRKRPYLWDLRHKQRDLKYSTALWSEIGQALNVDVTTCKKTWTGLRSHFCAEMAHIAKRIENARKAGTYDSKKKYYNWPYFDALRFVANGLAHWTKVDLSFGNGPDIEAAENNTAGQIKPQLLDSNSVQAATTNGTKVMESGNLDQNAEYQLRLIEEVRKRPSLWHFQQTERDLKNSAALWVEVAQVLDVDVTTCKATWQVLRRNFRREKARIAKRIAKAKKAGTYDPNTKYYHWFFFDALRFMANGLPPWTKYGLRLENDSDMAVVENNTTNAIKPQLVDSNSLQPEINDGIETMESDNLGERAVHKFQLIEEVRKRPDLWDRKHHYIDVKKSAALWSEIAQVLNADETTCKKIWQSLRQNFCSERFRIPQRIANAKKAGTYDPKKKYCNWLYSDALRFLTNGLVRRAAVSRSFETDSDSEIGETNNAGLFGSNSIQTASGNDTEAMESEMVDEFIEDDSLSHRTWPQEYYIDKHLLQKEIDSTNPLTAGDYYDKSKAKDTHFKSHTFAVSSCIRNPECATTLSYNTVLQAVSLVKEEPELLQIVAGKHQLENEGANELQKCNSSTVLAAELSDCSANYSLFEESQENKYVDMEEFISSPPGTNYVKQNQNTCSAFSEDTFFSSAGLNDEDYGFLYSFLPLTRAMTNEQEIKFHVNMQKLLAGIFPAAAAVISWHPDDHDADEKLLLNFYPVLKSLPVTQNLNFRLKMTELLYKILSTETNQYFDFAHYK